MFARALELRQKQVINIIDGKRLGYVYDIEMNLSDGKVNSLVIPGEGRILGMFGKNSDYIIPWENIKKIGRDTILVEFYEERNIDRKERKQKINEA